MAPEGATGGGRPPRTAAWVRPAVVAVLVLVALVGLALALRAGARLYHRFQEPLPVPRQADVGHVAGWMTVPHVARAYGVPGQELFAALGVAAPENARRSLDEIADRGSRDRDEVVAVVRGAVARLRSAGPSPPRSVPGPGAPVRGLPAGGSP